LSPKLMRDFKLFGIVDDDQKDTLEVNAIHNDEGYHKVRQLLSEQYNIGNIEPDIQVYNVDMRGDRSLTLRYTQHNRRPLDEQSTQEVLKHVYSLWNFPVNLQILGEDDKVVMAYQCPPID